MELGAQASRLGYRLNWIAQCGSTNDLARQALFEGADRLWVVTGEQIDGRGRNGRTWTPKAGNLYASLAVVDPAPVAQAPQIGFVAALAVHDAASTVCVGGAFGLKWPNDLLLDRRKVAGILVEGTQIGGGRLGVVVGFGVNIADHPHGTRYGATHLALARSGVTAAQTFAALSDAMSARLAQWRDDGFAAIREAWLARAVGLGETIRVSRESGDIAGRFEGVDGQGRLVLDSGSGVTRVDAGDVFLAGM